MHTLLLYTTSGCHLCDQAEALLNAVLDPARHSLVLVEICELPELIEQFGTRIPVLSYANHQLNWPFTPAQVSDFLHEVFIDG